MGLRRRVTVAYRKPSPARFSDKNGGSGVGAKSRTDATRGRDDAPTLFRGTSSFNHAHAPLTKFPERTLTPSMRQSGMRAALLLYLLFSAALAGRASAAPILLSPGLAASGLIDMSPPKVDKPSFFNWQIGGSLRRKFDRRDEQSLDPNVATQLVSVTHFVPEKLEIEALSGHRSFATQSFRDRTGNRMTVEVSNTILGVGTTMSFDATINRRVFLSPFVSLDYNRVDSARTVNLHSPLPFTRNNGDTGLVASAGATLSYVFGAAGSLRLSSYGAVSAGSRRPILDDNSATVATRVVKALSKPALDSVEVELGVGTSYALTTALRVDTAMVRSALADGRTGTSGTVALNLRF